MSLRGQPGFATIGAQDGLARSCVTLASLQTLIVARLYLYA